MSSESVIRTMLERVRAGEPESEVMADYDYYHHPSDGLLDTMRRRITELDNQIAARDCRIRDLEAEVERFKMLSTGMAKIADREKSRAEAVEDDLAAARVGAKAWQAIAERAESERDELRQQVEALQAKVHLCAGYEALEAKLRAVEWLPEKWRKYSFDNDESTSYMDSADCADELESILKGVQP